MSSTNEDQLPLFQKGTIKFIGGFLAGLLFGILAVSKYSTGPKYIVVLKNHTSDCIVNPLTTTTTPQVTTVNTTATPIIKATTESAGFNFTLTPNNIAAFYEEYYKFYELNKLWLKKSFMGISFLQNPNDAISIAEILCNQDIDLLIETGTFFGGSALFYASIMYQFRYMANTSSVRPFKIITIDINSDAANNLKKFTLLAPYITFLPDGSNSEKARSVVNQTFHEMKPKNVFISLDGDHFADAVHKELVFYQQFVNISNYILVQDTRLSRKWHPKYCIHSIFDGPCDGPLEAINWFLKNEGRGRFEIDENQEYLFTTNQKGWLKRIAL